MTKNQAIEQVEQALNGLVDFAVVVLIGDEDGVTVTHNCPDMVEGARTLVTGVKGRGSSRKPN